MRIPHPSTIIGWLLVILIVGYVFTNPAEAGATIHQGFESALTFVSSVAKG